MNKYLAPNNIKVFPISKPILAMQDSKILYESNMSNIVRQLLDTNGFIIKEINKVSATENESSEPAPFICFNLGGYYCEASKTQLFAGDISSKYIIATLKFDSNTLELQGLDNGTYTGIEFSYIDTLTDIGNNSIVLYEKLDNGDYGLFRDSFSKFKPNSIKINGIDGRH